MTRQLKFVVSVVLVGATVLLSLLVLSLIQERKRISSSVRAAYSASGSEIARSLSLPVKLQDVDRVQSILANSQLSAEVSYLSVVSDSGLSFGVGERFRPGGSLQCESDEFRVPIRYEYEELGRLVFCIRADVYPEFSFSISTAVFLVVLTLGLTVLWWVLMRWNRKELEQLATDLANVNPAAPDLVLGSLKLPRDPGLKDVYSKISGLLEDVSRAGATEKELRVHEARESLARQVIHDIKSPLFALKVVAQQGADHFLQQRAMVERAVSRLDSLVKALSRGESGSKGSEIWSLESVLVEVFEEKVIQFRSSGKISRFDLDLGKSEKGIFARVEHENLVRVLINLLNNSFEAIDHEGEIEIRLTEADGHAVVEVQDNGKGIPLEISERVFQRGATFGKKGGAGLGLFMAKQAVESWGGKISLAQHAGGSGTRVRIELPIQAPLFRLVRQIDFSEVDRVVILDDAKEDCDEWRDLLGDFAGELEVHHSSADVNWSVAEGENVLFLVDLHLGEETQTGLDLIRNHRLEESSILVTSAHLSGADFESLRVLPKVLLPYTSLVFSEVSLS